MADHKTKTVRVKVTKEIKDLDLFKEYELNSFVTVAITKSEPTDLTINGGEHPTEPPIHL